MEEYLTLKRIKNENSYTDLYDNPTELTDAELAWFNGIVNRFHRLPEASNIKITNCNHEELDKKQQEAYGIYWKPRDTTSDLRPYITIDNFFIHEMYETTFHDAYNLTGETLESCIAHEIAHHYQFRHCKRHTRITKEILKKYNSLPE